MERITAYLEHLQKLKPDFFFHILTAFFVVLVILLAGYAVIRVMNRMLRFLNKKGYISSPFIVFFDSIFKWIVFALTILLILQQVGIKLNSLWSLISAILAMVAIGFVAVWSVLSNLLCTLMLIIFHPFEIGDDLEVIDPAMTSGIRGRVRNINLMFTTLFSVDKDQDDPFMIRIPNNLLFQKILRVRSGKTTYRLDQQLFEERSLLGNKGSKPNGLK